MVLRDEKWAWLELWGCVYVSLCVYVYVCVCVRARALVLKE